MKYFLACVVVYASVAMAVEPITYDVTALLQSSGGQVSLLGGKQLQIARAWSADRVLFDDLLPGANWEHPARFRMVAASGATLESVNVTRPPLGLEAAPIVSGGPGPRGGEIKFAIDAFGGKHRVKTPEQFHAILINGRADLRHWNDFSFLYRVLTEIYGYRKENIMVVDGVYKDRQPDLDGDGTADIQYASTLAGLKEAMQVLAAKLKPTDQLLLAVNDHGGTASGESTIILFDGEIKASEFSGLLKTVKAGRILSLFEQCYSGGFVRPAVERNRVAMSAATDQEFSWASQDLNWDEWIYHAISAFAMQTHDGKKLDVDTNKDGKVSAQEAFAYSVNKDVARESPLLESTHNSGDASSIGLNF